MENATKALLMAGGILVGLIVISLGVRLFVNLNKSGKTYSSAPAIIKAFVAFSMFYFPPFHLNFYIILRII